nr:MAG TPA: hypothetical protein [Caudoviricetes sp.]
MSYDVRFRQRKNDLVHDFSPCFYCLSFVQLRSFNKNFFDLFIDCARFK